MSQRSAPIAAAIATADVSEPPRPSVVMRPVSSCRPWKPEITATSARSLMRRISSSPLTSRMRADAWACEVRIGSCQPCQERATIPIACSVIASNPEVTCSPEATTTSYSRASCSTAASRHHSTSRLVVPDMADTTTATSWPASTSRLTWRDTLRMRSMSATDVPPNFITSRAMTRTPASPRHGKIAQAGANWIDTGAVASPQPRVAGAGCIIDTRQGRALRMTAEPSHGDTTVDAREVARFSRLAAQWWDPHGKMAVLHKFNPVRLAYIRDAACGRFGRDAKRPACLDGLRILDIGCGAGILCEPLARLGAAVVGVDPSVETIEAAKRHAAEGSLTIDYR